MAGVMARHGANILTTQQSIISSGEMKDLSTLYFEFEGIEDTESLINELSEISDIHSVETHQPFSQIYGKRIIILGGGAQVAQVALGAVNEADRHNIRGERISVDTIPLVGEDDLAIAVEAVSRLPRASVLVLAGSIMGGKITKSVIKIQKLGIPVISLSMVGSVPDHADLVVTDPIQAGVLAVMHVSSKAVFDIYRVHRRRF
jgi:energy-converting hydrogenase B subunit Q